eukprot:15463285-Alexandrium_andersonii.AAC.2
MQISAAYARNRRACSRNETAYRRSKNSVYIWKYAPATMTSKRSPVIAPRLYLRMCCCTSWATEALPSNFALSNMASVAGYPSRLSAVTTLPRSGPSTQWR